MENTLPGEALSCLAHRVLTEITFLSLLPLLPPFLFLLFLVFIRFCYSPSFSFPSILMAAGLQAPSRGQRVLTNPKCWEVRKQTLETLCPR